MNIQDSGSDLDDDEIEDTSLHDFLVSEPTSNSPHKQTSKRLFHIGEDIKNVSTCRLHIF